jgi:hypothetical protein
MTMRALPVLALLVAPVCPLHLGALGKVFDPQLKLGREVRFPGPGYTSVALILTNVHAIVEKEESSLFHHLDRMMTSLLEHTAATAHLHLLVLTQPDDVAAIQDRLAVLLGRHLGLRVAGGGAGAGCPKLRVEFVDVAAIVTEHQQEVEMMIDMYTQVGTSVLMPGGLASWSALKLHCFISGDPKRHAWMNEGEKANEAFEVVVTAKVGLM